MTNTEALKRTFLETSTLVAFKIMRSAVKMALLVKMPAVSLTARLQSLEPTAGRRKPSPELSSGVQMYDMPRQQWKT